MLKSATTGTAIQEIGARICEALCRSGGRTIPLFMLTGLIIGITATVDESPQREGSR